MKDKKLVQTKTYTIELEVFSDGSTALRRTNDGFTVIELFGLVQLTTLDLGEQFRGTVKPDVIERRAVKQDKKEE